ncbi:MAG: CHAD domain-containing protein [Anaerolineae bacterium]|nr:CHAD domain-containing protein [Anaerolineae bacterium]
MEVEVKFSIPNTETAHCLHAMDQTAGYVFAPAETAEVHDTYLDTANWRILAAGYACRRRAAGGRLRFTLKAIGHTDGALHRREELEADLPADAPPAQWPPTPARDRLVELAGESPLIPLFEVRQTRHVRRIHHGTRYVGDWSLDEVHVVAGARTQSYLELEIERAGQGTEDDLLVLAAHVQETWGLLPQPRSKFERAWAFVAGTPALDPLLDAPGLHPDDEMVEAARKVLLFQFQRMALNEAGTLMGRDIEALHDMRVATRRMRAAFRVFADHFDAKTCAPFLEELRRAGNALGHVRDLDVFWEKTQAYLDGLPPEQRSELDSLHAAWAAARQRAREQMLAYLSSADYARFKKRFGAFLTTPGAGARRIANRKGEVRPHRLRYVAPALVYQRASDVLAYDGWVTGATVPPERLHRLRIAAKRLRYTIEFLREVLGLETETLIEQIKVLQDHLGAAQDAVVAGEMLRKFLEHGGWDDASANGTPVASPGAERYLDARQAELEALVTTFPALWEWFQGPTFTRQVAKAANKKQEARGKKQEEEVI